jgi:hypothetical protein
VDVASSVVEDVPLLRENEASGMAVEERELEIPLE